MCPPTLVWHMIQGDPDQSQPTTQQPPTEEGMDLTLMTTWTTMLADDSIDAMPIFPPFFIHSLTLGSTTFFSIGIKCIFPSDSLFILTTIINLKVAVIHLLVTNYGLEKYFTENVFLNKIRTFTVYFFQRV